MTTPEAAGRRIEIEGEVQGVGFRPWVWRLASAAGLGGRVHNDSTGVTIEAFGEASLLDSFLARLREPPPPAARIRALRWAPIPGEEEVTEFTIIPSRRDEGLRVSIPPDLATCEDCLAELFDRQDRRYRYPFINCTNCGPRFTIARSIPYDRPGTTMEPFALCPECRREYEDPRDRRFHAQPNACPACGPRLLLETLGGRHLEGEEGLKMAAEALATQAIVAVKGLGGFHLACDATCSRTVAELRRRKGRDEKPFAVMVEHLEAARRLALLSPEEEELLSGVERPIVLVRKRVGAGAPALAPEVAPGNPLVGLMLPYTPLHHLLLNDLRRPLVMTSGNRSQEPIVASNEEARERLDGIADVFLLHDREIASRCDDSVVQAIAGGPVFLRRSRGWVPRPVVLPRPVGEPILACGAQLKNTFAIAVGNRLYAGPHVGDLETLESVEWFEEAIGRMERFLEVRPELLAYDLHPDYLSTRYALERRARLRVPVQHHHAHLASAMAEHGLEGPVLGVVYDGTGYGTDGTIWGGEVLLGDAMGYERRASFRPIALAGGDRAVREVWRLALALLDDAFDGAPPLGDAALFARVPGSSIEVVRRMVAEGANTPRSRGVGRYFDALGALVLGRTVSRYEGQAALEWNLEADPETQGAYPYHVARGLHPWEIDLRPLVREVLADQHRGVPAPTISGRFHRALAMATAEVVEEVTAARRELPVVLSGGCFQNALLTEEIVRRLSGRRRVLVHREVPPGDGGIAVGQALVAGARLEKRRGVEGP